MMRKALAGLFLAGALVTSALAAGPLTLFTDREHGYAVAYPLWLFPLEAENPEGPLSLTSADGRASLRVTVRQGQPLEEALAAIRANFAESHQIAFNKEELTAITLSGSARDGRIGYLHAVRLANATCPDCVATLELTYPKQIRAAILRELTRMTTTLRATADPEFGRSRARALATANTDIARWMQRVARNRSTPILDAAEAPRDLAAPCVYTVHAYELARASDGSFKPASFGYYDADVCARTIKRQPLD